MRDEQEIEKTEYGLVIQFIDKNRNIGSMGKRTRVGD